MRWFTGPTYSIYRINSKYKSTLNVINAKKNYLKAGAVLNGFKLFSFSVAKIGSVSIVLFKRKQNY